MKRVPRGGGKRRVGAAEPPDAGFWGHPNGTATRSHSSDTIDECIRLNVEIYSAYGQYNP